MTAIPHVLWALACGQDAPLAGNIGGVDSQAKATKFPCPCCGHLVFGEPPGSYDICPVCFWEDDNVQLRWPDWSGGANRPSLIASQRAYREIGAMEYRFTGVVRAATSDEPVDEGWRAIEEARDDFEPRGQNEAPWPDDLTLLYWWRPTFWRRQAGVA